MLLVDDLAAGGTKNLRHTPRGLVTLLKYGVFNLVQPCLVIKSYVSFSFAITSLYTRKLEVEINFCF